MMGLQMKIVRKSTNFFTLLNSHRAIQKKKKEKGGFHLQRAHQLYYLPIVYNS